MDMERVVYQVIRLLEDIHGEANRAYWRTAQDCGSDFNPAGCDGCQHFQQCEQHSAIGKELGYLSELVGEDIRKEVNHGNSRISVPGKAPV